MSMNGFFKAFSLDACNTMLKDKALIDRWVWKEDKSVAATDISSAWDVLQHILGKSGFGFDVQVDNVLSNGCVFISPRKVIEHSKQLSSWSQERFIDALKKIDDEEIYHLDVFNDDDVGQEDLIEQFNKLVSFYADAAKRLNGVVFYLA